MDPSIIGSIIIASVGILGVFLSWFLHKKEKFSKSYTKRYDAELNLLEDMKNATKLFFLGISNTSLLGYFLKVINGAETDENILPFETIDVFFARDDVGHSWEDAIFENNIVEVIRNISFLFTDESHMSTMPKFRRLSFYQNTLVSYYGGSSFKLSHDKEGSRFSVIYVVNYILPDIDTKTSYTIKLNKKQKGPQNLYAKYLKSNEHIKEESNSLFKLEFEKNDLWDRSVKDWDAFDNNYHIYSNIMESLISFGEISHDHAVIDLGCGTGRASKRLADHLNRGTLLLLDRSPQMVKKAKESFGKYKNVDTIVADAEQPLYGAYKDKIFNRIIVHFSFQHFITDVFSITLFAENWKKHVDKEGEILIAIHNSFIECSTPTGFENWDDPLRKGIKDIAINDNLIVKQDLRIKYKKDDIQRGFETAGYCLKKIEEKVFQRNMNERIAMWRAPAILDSLLDVRQIDSEKCSKILRNVLLNVRSQETMPTTVVFFKFTLGNSAVQFKF